MNVLQWCKCSYLEFPPENCFVWTTDGTVVRKGKWFVGEIQRADYDFEKDSVWMDATGHAITVTHWIPIEESPDDAPALPLSD